MKKIISTNKAPKAIGTYSQGVQVGNLVFFSGQIGLNPETGEMANDFKGQLHRVMRNIKGLLEEVNASFDDIVKLTVFVQDLKDFATLNEIMAEYLKEPYPARSAVQAAKLPKNALVEVEAIVQIHNS